MNITQFFLEQQKRFPQASGELTLVLNDIASTCKKIAAAVNQGALAGNMGEVGAINVQGESQKQLDVIANQIFLESMLASGHIAGMASEEMEQPFEVPAQARQHGKYLLLFDPLDGSSNVNVNITVGSIFSILRTNSPNPQLADYLQAGTQQVCAGYALYGSSTMLVFTTGQGVNGFTLDHHSGEFLLTHPDIQIEADAQEFAINISNQRFWQPPVQRYVSECLLGKTGPRGKDFNMRWVGSMVAEVHRILMRGGVFLYPLDSKNQPNGGRLRLMYEANPMSWIVEQAGGAASTGTQRILDLAPQQLHQRVPVILGAKHEVALIAEYHAS